MALYEKVVLYGDSLLYGSRCSYGVSEALSRAMREATSRHWIVYNETIPGEKTIELLRRMDQKNKVYDDVSFVAVLIGTNDSKPQNRTRPDLYEELYRQIMERFLTMSHLTKICITHPPLIEPICSPYDKECQSYLNEYSGRVRSIADEFGAHLVELSDMKPELFSDGVHFNDSGVDEVAKRIRDVVLKR